MGIAGYGVIWVLWPMVGAGSSGVGAVGHGHGHEVGKGLGLTGYVDYLQG